MGQNNSYELIWYDTETTGLNVWTDKITEIAAISESNKEFLELLKFFLDVYHQTMEAFYKSDKKKAHELELQNNDRIKKCIQFLKDNPKYFNAEISYLLRNISRALRDISRTTCSVLKKIF